MHHGKECGGTKMYIWNDGSSSNYGDMANLENCQTECHARRECHGFVFRESDKKCGLWEGGEFSLPNLNGFSCYVKKSNVIIDLSST